MSAGYVGSLAPRRLTMLCPLASAALHSTELIYGPPTSVVTQRVEMGGGAILPIRLTGNMDVVVAVPNTST